MGLFTPRQVSTPSVQVKKCKICGKPLITEDEMQCDLCTAHAIIVTDDVNAAMDAVARAQDMANAESDPDNKIMYLKIMLGYIYEIKVKYYDDSDVRPLQQDPDDLIDAVIHAISTARL